VLLIGELQMDLRFRAVFSHIRKASLLEPADLAYMDNVIRTLVRLRDSLLPELGILVLLIVHTAATYKGLVDATAWLAHGVGGDLHLTTAGWYVVLVSAPIFQLLVGLGLWKWALRTFFTFKLSRRNSLGLTASAFALVAFAAAVVIGATWRQEILYDGARFTDFKLPAIALVVIIALVALGPLAFFVPRLAALRRKGNPGTRSPRPNAEQGFSREMHRSARREGNSISPGV
jgi:hypothetical protein